MRRWLLVIIGLWSFQGCSASDSVEVAITFPDQAGKDATITLRTYSLIPGEGVSCSTLQDGTNSPDDGLSVIEAQQSAVNPFTDPITPLKVSKKNTATRLFFSQGENDVGMVIVRGCSEVNVADGETKVSISLAACAPSCRFGKGNCDNDLSNGCEVDLNTTLNCGGCGIICGNQYAISVACANRTCSYVCEQGRGNCDQIGSNGCESEVNTIDNCGACRNKCGSENTTSVSCDSGTCTISCQPSWGNCDHTDSNGCETDLSQTYGCNTVAEPVFNLSAGTYDHNLNIDITCSTSGATVYYTTDGITQPTEASTKYTGIPILIPGPLNTTTIMAIATHPGMNQSMVASATYTVRRQYTLTLAVNDSQHGSVEPVGPLTVDHGAATNITATVTSNTYKFSGWEEITSTGVVFGNAKNANTTVTLTGGNATIQARFDPQSGVYVAGDAGDIATVWKDGIKTPITDAKLGSMGFSIFVSGSDVYVSGSQLSGSKSVATVWKNGTATALSNGSINTVAESVFVSGSEVYAAGYEFEVPSVAKAWKGLGTIETTTLNEWSGNAYAKSVFVYNNSVYVAGYEYDATNSSYVAKVWKDKVIFQTLTAGSDDTFAYSVFVSGSDVYVAGFKNLMNSVATVWKNNEATSLIYGSNKTVAASVFVSGSDIYVAGYEYDATNKNYVAMVWINGVATPLTDGSNTAYANSVFVSGSDVYVAGYELVGSNYVAMLWINGAATPLTDGSNSAKAHSVFVAP